MPEIYDKVSLGKSMIGNTCIIHGTRPEIIKMSSVVRACERQGADYFMIHTRQGCSCDVDRVFFEQLGLPDARYNLDVGSGSGRHGVQVGRMMAGIEDVFCVVFCRGALGE